MDDTEANLPVGLRRCNHWKNLTTVSLQALPFLVDSEVYPVLQEVGVANVAQPEGVVLSVETTERDKWHIHHFEFNQGIRQANCVNLQAKLLMQAKEKGDMTVHS